MLLCRIVARRPPNPSPFSNAAIVLGNYRPFSKGERLGHPCVKSRMFLWCKAGEGETRVNGERISMRMNDTIFLPWGHTVAYTAAIKEPFLVAAVHVIPFHAPDRRIVHDVAHRPDHALFDCAWRQDLPLPGLVGVRRASLSTRPCLRHLADYIIQWWQAGRRPEWQARFLAALFLAELASFYAERRRERSAVFSPELEQMTHFVRSHIHQKFSLRDLARFSGRSLSWVGRRFQRHLRMSPVAYITRARMEVARELLATSRIPVGEAGRRVGIEDPYYFSKLFKKTVGRTPLEYRKKSSLF